MLWTDALESQFDRHTRERGEDYEALGRVRLVRATGDDAEATVRGTRPYRVYVARGTGGVSISCTCPRSETTPCKHVWATLAALDRDERPKPVGPGRTLPSLPPRAKPVALWPARLDGLASQDSTDRISSSCCCRPSAHPRTWPGLLLPQTRPA